MRITPNNTNNIVNISNSSSESSFALKNISCCNSEHISNINNIFFRVANTLGSH